MAEWKSKILYTVSQSTDKNDSSKGYGMWLIQYILDGESKAIKLVCGSWYTKDIPGPETTQEVRYGAKGMGLKDFDALRPHWAKVKELMTNPPPIVAEGEKEGGGKEIPF